MNTHFRARENFVRIVDLTPELKRKIEDAVENLLLILDAYEGDADAEPSIGWPNPGHLGDHKITKAMSCDDDREDDSELEPTGDEDEPALGWTETESAFGLYQGSQNYGTW